MKSFIIPFLLFLSTHLSAQTPLGIGLVSINFTDTTVLNFYSKPEAGKPVNGLRFFMDSSINGVNLKGVLADTIWMKPEVLWLDYSYLVFRYKSERNGYLEAIVNNETGATLWVKRDTVAEFVSWEGFLKGMYMIERLDSLKHPVREKPGDTAREIKYASPDCFNAERIVGEWMEVSSSGDCESKLPGKTAWIKWREGNKLLIQYFMTE